ncbi:hypothetical protein CEXT_22871 [Caerostris extrusa]|uniref:Uncharacterized protein n=1 Tax=Caerostris extrusa TaxID=172846 RepID=A0AAV4VCX0_CAEEX|nr:hypothetical protein CEXT_22871 [Caerostris extrusa]
MFYQYYWNLTGNIPQKRSSEGLSCINTVNMFMTWMYFRNPPRPPPQYHNLDRNVSNGISKEQEEGGGAASGGDDGNWSREKVSETSPSSVPEVGS